MDQYDCTIGYKVIEINIAHEPDLVSLRITPPPFPIPAKDVAYALASGGVVLLAGEAEGLVGRGAGAPGVDSAVGLVLGAPVDGCGSVGLEDGRAEVVGEGPVGGVCGYVDLGHWLAPEPDVIIGDGRRGGGTLSGLGHQRQLRCRGSIARRRPRR